MFWCPKSQPSSKVMSHVDAYAGPRNPETIQINSSPNHETISHHQIPSESLHIPTTFGPTKPVFRALLGIYHRQKNPLVPINVRPAHGTSSLKILGQRVSAVRGPPR